MAPFHWPIIFSPSLLRLSMYFFTSFWIDVSFILSLHHLGCLLCYRMSSFFSSFPAQIFVAPFHHGCSFVHSLFWIHHTLIHPTPTTVAGIQRKGEAGKKPWSLFPHEIIDIYFFDSYLFLYESRFIFTSSFYISFTLTCFLYKIQIYM